MAGMVNVDVLLCQKLPCNQCVVESFFLKIISVSGRWKNV